MKRLLAFSILVFGISTLTPLNGMKHKHSSQPQYSEPLKIPLEPSTILITISAAYNVSHPVKQSIIVRNQNSTIISRAQLYEETAKLPAHEYRENIKAQLYDLLTQILDENQNNYLFASGGITVYRRLSINHDAVKSQEALQSANSKIHGAFYSRVSNSNITTLQKAFTLANQINFMQKKK